MIKDANKMKANGKEAKKEYVKEDGKAVSEGQKKEQKESE